MLSLIAFIVAAFFFALAWFEADVAHAIDIGLFATAVGLALSQLPYGPAWPRRAP